jgi:NTP pyrophosphatase (non-canonical NTP hydrolase)
MQQKIFVEPQSIESFIKKIKNHELVWNEQDRLLHLFEEVGEFSEIILQYNKRKKPFKTKVDIENGVADIFEDLFALCVFYEIDINKIIKKVIYEE